MLGLQTLDLSNTRISGSIPEELGNLPFLMNVDIRNTLMTCCKNYSAANAANQALRKGQQQQQHPRQLLADSTSSSSHPPQLLPSFLVFDDSSKRSATNERVPTDPFLRKVTASIGENIL